MLPHRRHVGEVHRLPALLIPGDPGGILEAALRMVLRAAEDLFPNAERYELFTSHKSEKNLHIYEKCGYRPFKTKVVSDKLTTVFLEKARAET